EDKLHYVRRVMEKAIWNEMKKQRDEDPDKRFFFPLYESEDFLLKSFNGYLKTLSAETPNRDVVIFSIIFHDAMKVLEYTYANETEDKMDILFPSMTFSKKSTSLG